MKRNHILIILNILVLALLAALIFHQKRQDGMFAMFSSVEALRLEIGKFGAAAPVAFGLIQILSVIFAPIPNNIVTLAGGAMFGAAEAFFISTVSITIGSSIAFALSRAFGKPLVCKLVDEKIMRKYESVSASKQDMFVFFALLLPFFPDDAICFIAGLGTMRISRFFIISLVTRPWGLVVASVLGSGNIVIPIWGWAIILLLTASFFVLGIKYGSKLEDKMIKRFQKKR